MAETTSKMGVDLKFLEQVAAMATKLMGKQVEVPKVSSDLDYEVHGGRQREDVVGHCIGLMETHLGDYPMQAPNLRRLVDAEIAARAFNLSNMRLSELRRVRKWLSSRMVSDE